MPDFIDEVERWSGDWMLNELSAGWFGVLCATTGNLLAQGMTLSARSALLLDVESPDDVLSLIGAERRMPRYPLESVAQYRSRLHGAWEAYRYAGSAFAIEGQLAAAGYPGAQVRYYERPGPNGEVTYWSQFWVLFPPGTHPVTGPAEVVGGFDVGDGTVVGVVGGSVSFFATLRSLVKQWKAVQWICRGFVFALSGAEVGGFDVGDGTVVGSTIEAPF